jgi:hypothetical protein
VSLPDSRSFLAAVYLFSTIYSEMDSTVAAHTRESIVKLCATGSTDGL